MADEDILEQEQEEVETLSLGQDAWPGAQPKQAAFLTALVISAGRVAKAARAAKINRATVYRWLDDETFQQHYKRAMGQVTQVLEDEAIRRATDGVTKGIYYQGTKVGTERVYSDGLMQFLLRGAAPEKYRERSDVSGSVNHTHKWTGTMEELLATYRQLQKKKDEDDGL